MFFLHPSLLLLIILFTPTIYRLPHGKHWYQWGFFSTYEKPSSKRLYFAQSHAVQMLDKNYSSWITGQHTLQAMWGCRDPPFLDHVWHKDGLLTPQSKTHLGNCISWEVSWSFCSHILICKRKVQTCQNPHHVPPDICSSITEFIKLLWSVCRSEHGFLKHMLTSGLRRWNSWRITFTNASRFTKLEEKVALF